MTIATMDVSAQCGCNYTATKRISKTASITSISKTQRATRFNVWSNIKSLLIVFIIIMTQLSAISQADARPMANRPRQLMKRHSNRNWENPCGGVFEGHTNNSGGHEEKMKSLHSLRKAARDTFTALNTSSVQWINTTDIQMWFSHNRTYKFLPKLRRNSSIALSRWYRHMQTFVASFSYLHSMQHKFDVSRLNDGESNTANELELLLNQAKYILCLIESSINVTTPLSREKKLSSISLDDMNKKLKFRTKKQHEEKPYPVDFIDLKFVKFYFMDFLQKMGMILRQKKPPGKNNSNSINHNFSDISSISSNSKSVNSKEVNSTKKRLGAKKRKPTKKPQPQKKPRQRPYKKQHNSSEQSVA